MNILAEELNKILSDTCASRLLSTVGLRMYFPKGILSQSAEASERAYKFNATIGMAYTKGEPMILDAIHEHLPLLSAKEAVAYAPTAGVAALRESWRKQIFKKNPSLEGKHISLPVAVPGLTAGISYLADMFVNPDDPVVVPDMFWPNYRLVMEERKGASLSSYPFFNEQNGFNVPAMVKAIHAAADGRRKAVLILNFPNNPTGYTPTVSEGDAIVKALVEIADSGIDLFVISDDAYFGLQYEEGTLRESIFARLADVHPNILAAKVDGATKEDFVWGFRGGYITYACKGMDEHKYGALVKKLMGVIRSSISNAAGPTQYILLKAMEKPSFEIQKAQFMAILDRRYHAVKKFLAANAAPAGFKALPFNSGYFMCFLCEGFSAEALRMKLLEEYAVGVISMQEKWLRVAFSTVEENDIPELYSIIFKAASEMPRKA